MKEDLIMQEMGMHIEDEQGLIILSQKSISTLKSYLGIVFSKSPEDITESLIWEYFAGDEGAIDGALEYMWNRNSYYLDI